MYVKEKSKGRKIHLMGTDGRSMLKEEVIEGKGRSLRENKIHFLI